MTTLRPIALALSAVCLLSFCSAVASAADDVLVPMWKDGKIGYVDRSGKEVIAPQFEKAEPFSEGRGAVLVGGKWGYVDATGKTVIEPRYQEAGRFSGALARVKLNDLFGYVDPSGKQTIAPQFREAFDFSDGLALVKFDGDAGFAFIDRAGKRAFEGTFDAAWPFSEGLACIRQGTRCGFIDAKGKVVIEPSFRAARRFSGGLAAIKVGRVWGFIDKTGKTVVEPAYEEVGDFSEGLAAAMTGGVFGYIDVAGKVVVKPAYAEAREFSEGLAAVKVGTAWGYIDRQGTAAISPKFESAEAFKGGTACVVVGREKTFIDRAGMLLHIDQPFDEVGPAAEGLVPVRLGQKWGYADAAGKIVIPLQFDEARAFSDGLAAVGMRDPESREFGRRDRFIGDYAVFVGFKGEVIVGVRWGFIDKAGKGVVKPVWSAVGPFQNGTAAVGMYDASKSEAMFQRNAGFLNQSVNVKWGRIDRAGKLIAEAKYEGVGAFSEGLAWFSLKGSYGFLDEKGKEAIEAKYGWAGSFHDGRAPVFVARRGSLPPTLLRAGEGEVEMRTAMDGSCCFIDKTGKVAIEGPFEMVREFSEGRALVQKEYGNSFFIDTDGKTLAAEEGLEFQDSFRGGLAVAEGKDNKRGFIDRSGKLVVPCSYKFVHPFDDGLARVAILPEGAWVNDWEKCLWGFIDAKGNAVIELKYQRLGLFREGLARFRTMEKVADKTGFGEDRCYYRWGFIDPAGKVVIEPKYAGATDFSSGLALVTLPGKGEMTAGGGGTVPRLEMAYIDRAGKIVMRTHDYWGEDYPGHGGE